MIAETPLVRRAKKQKIPDLYLIILSALLLVSVGVAVFFYIQYRNAAEGASENLADLVNEISLLIYLPERESPTIATVTDPEVLKDQEFFANAKAGDKVLVYVEAKKAILYRPSEKKIVEVGPFYLPPDTPAAL